MPKLNQLKQGSWQIYGVFLFMLNKSKPTANHMQFNLIRYSSSHLSIHFLYTRESWSQSQLTAGKRRSMAGTPWTGGPTYHWDNTENSYSHLRTIKSSQLTYSACPWTAEGNQSSRSKLRQARGGGGKHHTDNQLARTHNLLVVRRLG